MKLGIVLLVLGILLALEAGSVVYGSTFVGIVPMLIRLILIGLAFYFGVRVIRKRHMSEDTGD